MKHRWHDEIVAWAGGAEIECRYLKAESYWGDNDEGITLFDNPDYEFRIKPQPIQQKYLDVWTLAGKIVLKEGDSVRLSGYRRIGKIEVQDD